MSSRDLHDRLDSLTNLFDQGGIVYLITCVAPGRDSGKQYVGLTTGPVSLRIYSHLLKSDYTNCLDPLYDAIRTHTPFDKYFTCEIVARAHSWRQLRIIERQYIRELGTHISLGHGYNLSWGGEGAPPLQRLMIRIENEISRRQIDLEEGNKHARKEFVKKHNIRWNSVNQELKLALLENDAIQREFCQLFEEHESIQLLIDAVKTSDTAVIDAVEEVLQKKPNLISPNLIELLAENKRSRQSIWSRLRG